MHVSKRDVTHFSCGVVTRGQAECVKEHFDGVREIDAMLRSIDPRLLRVPLERRGPVYAQSYTASSA